MESFSDARSSFKENWLNPNKPNSLLKLLLLPPLPDKLWLLFKFVKNSYLNDLCGINFTLFDVISVVNIFFKISSVISSANLFLSFIFFETSSNLAKIKDDFFSSSSSFFLIFLSSFFSSIFISLIFDSKFIFLDFSFFSLLYLVFFLLLFL
jgi:hypothetical protein